MYWADELASTAQRSQVVNDSKTPSGTVHIGSLRGVVLHDAIWRALRAAGVPATYRYGVDDMDPMDAQALLTPDAVQRYMGVPLAHVPPPPGSTAPNYARHFAGRFLETFAGLGIHPTIYWMSEEYGSGKMDRFIRLALEHAEDIRAIYLRVSRVEKPRGWLPVEVVCEACGRVGTTHATDWDGATLRYDCLPDYVSWAQGCGHGARVSPFGGRVKLPWNVEWAAQWSLFGVTIEGCGKDLATAGGSRARADEISRTVFEREPPRNVPYEFLNVGGRKMSTSRGQGASAHEMAALLPPELIRFLFLRHRPNHALDFDPSGDAIPRLFDEFDRIAAASAGLPVRGELPPEAARIFQASLLDPDEDPRVAGARYRPAFLHLALLSQVPGVDVASRLAAEKGGPLDPAESAIAERRLDVARAWLAEFAPEQARVEVRRDALPDEARGLSGDQRRFLRALAAAAETAGPETGERWQDAIFAAARACGVPAGRAFAALYAAFLGRSNGPRAGWLLASLPGAFVLERLQAAAGEVDEHLAGGAGVSQD